MSKRGVAKGEKKSKIKLSLIIEVKSRTTSRYTKKISLQSTRKCRNTSWGENVEDHGRIDTQS